MSIYSAKEHFESGFVGRGALKLSSDYLILLLELGFEKGVNQVDLLKNSDLSLDIIMQPGISVGADSFLQVIENFITRLPDLYYAVEYGERMTLSKHGALGVAAQYSPSLEEAAIKVVTYISTRVELFSLARERHEHKRILHIRYNVASTRAVDFLALAFLTSMEMIIRRMLAITEAVDTRIEIPCACHLWQGRDKEIEFSGLNLAAKGAQVYFDQPQCRLIWPNNILDEDLPFFDYKLSTVAEEVCADQLKHSAAKTIKRRVEEIISAAENSMPRIEGVAAEMNMSAATLKRKLKLELTSFSELKESILFQKSVQLLMTADVSIEQVTDKLGYSDTSNFSKAFKAWSGTTPNRFRQQNSNH
jgi:AraC-like DNA-binding protein